MYGNYTRYLMHQVSRRQEQQVADWNRRFEEHVVAASPAHAGRINWGAVQYLRDVLGLPPDAAAQRHVEHEPPVAPFGGQRT